MTLFLVALCFLFWRWLVLLINFSQVELLELINTEVLEKLCTESGSKFVDAVFGPLAPLHYPTPPFLAISGHPRPYRSLALSLGISRSFPLFHAPLRSFSLSLAITRPSRSLSLSLGPSRSFLLFLTASRSLSLLHSRSRSLSHCLAPSHGPSRYLPHFLAISDHHTTLSLPRTISRSFSLLLALPRTLSLSLAISCYPSFSLAISSYHSLALAPSRYHSLTRPFLLTITHSWWKCQSFYFYQVNNNSFGFCKHLINLFKLRSVWNFTIYWQSVWIIKYKY